MEQMKNIDRISRPEPERNRSYVFSNGTPPPLGSGPFSRFTNYARYAPDLFLSRRRLPGDRGDLRVAREGGRCRDDASAAARS
jgi:hypothetical protein